MKSFLYAIAIVVCCLTATAQNSATFEVWRDADLFKLSTITTDSVTYEMVGTALSITIEAREPFAPRTTRRLQITIPNFTGIGQYDPSTGTQTYWENFTQTKQCRCFDHAINDVNITKWDTARKEVAGTFNWKCESFSTGTGEQINYRIRNGVFDVGAAKVAIEATPKDSIVVATLANDTTLRITVKSMKGADPHEGVKIMVNNKLEEVGPTYTEKGVTDANGEFVYDFQLKKDTPSGNYVVSIVGEKADFRKSDTAKITVYWGSRFWNYQCAGVDILEFDAGEGREWKPETEGSTTLKSNGPVTIGGVIKVEGIVRINTTAGQNKVFIANGTRIVIPNVRWSATETSDLLLDNIIDGGDFPLPDCDGIIKFAAGLAAKKLNKKMPGGVEVGLEEFKIINRADAKGISIKGKITVAQARVGCDPVADSAGGFEVPDDARQGLTVGVTVTGNGFENLSFEASAIALTHAVCMNQFALNADFVNEVYSLAGKFTFPVKGTEISLGGAVLFKNNPSNPDNKLHFDSLMASLELGDCRPIPNTPLCFAGLTLSTSGWSNPNATGRAVRAQVTLNSIEQVILDKAPWIQTLFGEPTICELDGTVEYRHPLIFTGAIGAKFFKLKKISASKPWQMEGLHTAYIDFNNSIGISGSYKIGHLGLDDYFLSANGAMTFFWNPTIGASATVNGLVRIPAPGDDVLDIPVGGAILRFLSLSGFIPQTLGSANASVLVNEDNGFRITATVDVSQNPVNFIRSFGRMAIDFKYKDTLGFTMRSDTLSVLTVSPKMQEQAQGAAQPVDTIVVDNTVERVFVLISGKTTAPVSRITAPDGTNYDATSPDSTVQRFETPGNEMTAWTLVNPVPGNWILTLTSPQAGDEVEVTANRTSTPFAITASESNRTATVTWAPTSNTQPTDEVRLFIDTDTLGYNGVFIGQASESAGTFSFTIPAEMTECTYYIHATRNVAGQSLASTYSTTAIRTAGNGVAQPVEVRAISNQFGRTSVQWRMAPGSIVNGFLVYVRDAQGNDSLYATAFAGDRLVMLDIVDQTTKSIVIIAFNDQGLRGCATEALGITTGIEDNAFVTSGARPAVDYSIVPNPTNGRTVIRFNAGSVAPSGGSAAHNILAVDIINLLGMHIATLPITDPTSGWNQVEWDASAHPAGTYYIVIRGSHGSAVAPISVVR